MRAILSIACLIASAPVQAQVPVAWDIQRTAEQQVEGTENIGGLQETFSAPVDVLPHIGHLAPGDMIRVPMPEGGMVDGVMTSNFPTATGGRHLQIDLESGDRVLMHIGLNATYARIWQGDAQYEISPSVGGGLVLRTSEDPPLAENDGVLDPGLGPVSAMAAEDGLDRIQAGSDTLDFLYFYDIQMIETHGWGLPDLAVTDIGNLTTALVNSGVPLTADLTQLQFMDVAIDYPSDDLLTDLGGRRGVFDGLQDRIDSLQTDVISLNRVYDSSRENFCGLGYVHNPESTLFGRSHINVCHNGLTLAHETGHNMGLAHGVATDCDEGVDNCSGSRGRPVNWARGFRIDSATADGGIFTSVMAYGANRTPQFSDPNVECPERGSFCGVPIDDAAGNGAYAARALTDYATGQPSRGVPNPRLASAVLPTSRYVATNTAATAFMTVINPGSVDGTNCIIEHHGPYRNSFSYQTTDPATNGLTGSPDTPVNIPAGGYQTFLVSLTPGDDITSTVRFAPYASCDNIPMALVSPGLNTIDLGADTAGGPDLIALSATINNNGIVDIAVGPGGVFSVATINLGGAGDVTVSARSLDPGLPATGLVCQTDGVGACMANPAESLTLNIGANETPTFGVFVQTDYVTPFDASQRFQFQMQVDGQVRGSTSVAIRDSGDLVPPGNSAHAFTVTAYDQASGNLSTHATGYYDRFEIVSGPGLGTLTLDAATGAYTYTAGGAAGGDTFTYRAGNSSGWSPAMAATVTVDALPVPVVTAFTLEDDTDGTFAVDLDDHADGNIEIDRFVLTTPPSIPYSFNNLTGVVSGTFPSESGSHTFEFSAENQSGQGTPVTGTFNVIAYDACAPANLTQGRLQRRLQAISLAEGAPDDAEAITMGEALCMEEYNVNPDDSWVYFRNTALDIRVVFGPRTGPDRYIVYYRTAGGSGWTGNFSLCKNGSSLGAC
ncbi:hypothetical protein V0U79_01430 [Hyphobacterium sp. HN65]|uniref:Peptidase M12B domain-containing protein n=1 Tax=Hyphobacterium lacteum TaxID=3116575 RepID=A0ABU7LM65_9PROT|nr:hypothetical protein [Hyphobacterium sp. HN65]MEE2525010.1 hypothetical protein [Hyphobacterium sp. HN65]